jgi:hypothetical protein
MKTIRILVSSVDDSNTLYLKSDDYDTVISRLLANGKFHLSNVSEDQGSWKTVMIKNVKYDRRYYY